MYSVIEIPHFPLQARLRDCPPELGGQPVAVLEAEAAEDKRKAKRKPPTKGRAPIIGLTPAALAKGVYPGMTAPQGQARCPELVLLQRSAQGEAAAQNLLLACAADATPDYEATAPGVTTLNLLGSLHFFGSTRAEGWRGFAERTLQRLAAEGLTARIGLAANPDLARLAAELAAGAFPVQHVEGTPEAVKAFLGPLPIAALHPSAELNAILRLWGIRRVESFLALPVEEVSARLGPEGVQLWQLGQDGQNRLLRLVRPAAVYRESYELEYEIEQLEQLLFMLRLFLEKILARLASASRAAGELLLTLTLRGGSPYQRGFRIPEPSCDLELLFRMLSTHLDTVTTPEPVIGVALEALPARAGQQQPDFFEQGLQDPNRFAETLARLEGLLGAGRVGRPEVLDTHRPEAIAVTPFLEGAAAEGQHPHPPSAVAPRGCIALGPPLRRFRPPRIAQVRLSPLPGASQAANARKHCHSLITPTWVEAGEVRGQICKCRGPWMLSGEWWDTAVWARQEWDIQLETGGIYRLAYQAQTKTWTLEGIY